ncbi:hypothetical protein [Sandaracinobacteroides saxicola]|uniref:Uncharacterized protein n=1 Tax=Sandaracinobacteroides saxicola TaxID=2759707 RepID=A0A7G5IFL5_9SPHN|nr:hypothetical protein [Sandaracinobacteroides saxicola]QMW22157.1 hypothetical protein H3309_12380 [Sandaracinobacteroides saxicola]
MIPSQGQGTITFYERPDFGGAAITFRQTEGAVRVPFLARSIRAEGVWRVCSGTGFTGRCVLVDDSHRDSQRELGLMLAIQSVEARGETFGNSGSWPSRPQPMPSQIPQPGWGMHAHADWAQPPGGANLRGIHTQFFATPQLGRERVESCPGGQPGPICLADTAARFCAHAGWNRALSYGQQIVGRRAYLVDLLCTSN